MSKDDVHVAQHIGEQQRRLLVPAQMVLGQLSEQGVAAAEQTVPEVDSRTGKRAWLWTLENELPSLYNTAVALSAIARKFGSLLSRDRGATTVALVDREKVVLVKGDERTNISHDYMIACLVDAVGVPEECAHEIWHAVIALLKENRIQLPGLIAGVLADMIILALEEDVLGFLTNHAQVRKPTCD